jgi:hypothetical protein
MRTGIHYLPKQVALEPTAAASRAQWARPRGVGGVAGAASTPPSRSRTNPPALDAIDPNDDGQTF